MGINCEIVWRESSNYIEGEIDPGLRAAIDEHIHACKRCAAVLDGMKNIVQLYGDERMSEVPLGFGSRLHQKLEERMVPSRRGFLGWGLAFAASVLVAGSYEVARSSSFHKPTRISKHAQPAAYPIPPDLKVLVSQGGKLFHLPQCTAIINRETAVAMTAQQAMRDGYTPCTRCLKKYLREEESNSV